MLTIRLKAVIDRNQQLHLQLPSDTPAGEAEVVVIVQPSTDLADVTTTGSWLDFFAQLDADPRPRLSAQELDHWVEDERNAWD
jgi:hypothetical protein